MDCKLCGERDLPLFYTQGDRDQYRFYRCPRCRLVVYDTSTGVSQEKYVLHAVDPAATPPTSVRETGEPPGVVQVDRTMLAKSVAEVAEIELAAAAGGTVGVLVPTKLLPDVRQAVLERLPTEASGEPLESPVSVLSVHAAKGLEFDNVVLVEPAVVAAAGRNGLRDLYVAMTRPTQRLTVVHAEPLPPALHAL